jgi:long-chain acyl-CoA synthetase
MRVVDTSGVSLESGERGELQVRGTSMFNRYWNRPEADVNAFDGDWFRTGDAAIINTDGFVFIVDRIKDIVIRGGENIACNAVEAALVEHPLVIEACVYGMPDERLGEEVGATIFISAPIVEKELEDFLFARLAKFEVPRHIDQTHSPLQRGASGKILRRAIKADAITRFHKL